MTPDAPREIEAKYALADAAALEALAALRALGPYQLEPAGAPEDQRNTYFDTADMRVAARRGGLRVREAAGRRIATVKAGGVVRDGVHERAEWEVELPPGSENDAPERWPASPAREAALDLTGGAPLLPVVRVRTLRRNVAVLRDGAPVAELSLDEGVIAAGGREQPFRELELELRPGGTRDDLTVLAGLLADHAALAPEDRTKLGRGLELLEAGRRAQPGLAALAAALFERAAGANVLAAEMRGPAALAAAAYEAALDTLHESPWAVARDALLAGPIAGVAYEDLALAAGAVALLRERPRPRREVALVALRCSQQAQARRLGALLRVAVPLKGAAADVSVAGGVTRVAVADEAAAARVEAAADMWRRRIGALEVVFEPTPAGGLESLALPPLVAVLDRVAAEPVRLHGGAPAAEGARRVLRRFFERMLAREDGVRKGAEREDVHQMRVATRRLRASLAVVESLFDAALVRRFRRALRGAAAALGAVRDDDVFLDSVLAYAETLPLDARAALDPQLGAVRADREAARRRLAATLAAGRHRRFKRDFAAFLITPGAGAAPAPASGPLRVRDMAGGAIWRRFEELRAFEAALPGASEETLHQARIAGKRLRYTLELFAEALGPGADEALGPLAELQEALGSLQDEAVARSHVRRLGLADDDGARTYLAALEERGARQVEELPAIWERATGAVYSRRLLELIDTL